MIGFGNAAARPAWPASGRTPARGGGGAIAGAHPLVVDAGLAVLESGGNAVDAALAGALAASVVMPEMCGLGGDLFAIVHTKGASPICVLGSGAAPRAANLDQMLRAGPPSATGPKMPQTGGLSITVPGMPAACGALVERFGSRPFAELAEPAIALAEHGFDLTPRGAAAVAEQAALLASRPESAAVFLPGGAPPCAGARLRQPDLAATLRRLARDGVRAFYEGDLARRIAAGVQAAGGVLSQDDLAEHRNTLGPTIRTRYRGRTVHQTPLPTQGLVLLEALNIAEHAPADDLARYDAAAVHILVEALKLAFADRNRYALDPDFGETPLDRLLSKSWAAERFGRIDPVRAGEDVLPGPMSGGDTTYLCTADGDGTMVSLILSLSNAFGSGVVAGDTGVLLNNRAGRGFSLTPEHPNIFAPGKKPITTLNCYAMADEAGDPVLVGGTPGGDGQPQWALQALVGLIDAGLDVQQAIEIPRWLVWPATDPINLPNPYKLVVEDRLGEDVLHGLEQRGHRLSRVGPWSGGGAVSIIGRNPMSGELIAGADPRAEGRAGAL